ncbi:MAG TPA: hypothetical protein VMG10_00735 [Gemmataceae bacterium]|nr:hypothetical protein [Gemmataceae bacterium]
MYPHSHRPEDLNELERRLSAWQPSPAGLDADTMLFAAGRASAASSPARFAWPGLSLVLTALTIVLSMALAAERGERQALARQLRENQQPPSAIASPSPAANVAAEELPVSDEPPPDSYLASRRALEKGMDAWPVRVVVHAGPPEPSVPNPPILRLGQRDALLEP